MGENVFVKNDENAPRDKRAMFRANANKRGALEREKSQPGEGSMENDGECLLSRAFSDDSYNCDMLN